MPRATLLSRATGLLDDKAKNVIVVLHTMVGTSVMSGAAGVRAYFAGIWGAAAA